MDAQLTVEQVEQSLRLVPTQAYLAQAGGARQGVICAGEDWAKSPDACEPLAMTGMSLAPWLGALLLLLFVEAVLTSATIGVRPKE